MRMRSLGARSLAAVAVMSLLAGIVPMAATGMSPMCPTSPCNKPAFSCCCDMQAPAAPAPSAAVSVAVTALRVGADHPIAGLPLPDLFATSFVTQRALVTAASRPPADRLTLLATLLI